MSTGDLHTETARLVEALRARLAGIRARRQTLDLQRRLLRCVAIGLLTGFVLILAESVGYFSPAVRSFAAGAFVFLLLPALSAYVSIPLLRRLGLLQGESIESTARWVGEYHPAVRDRLLNIIQLGSPREHHAWVSSDLITESVRTLVADLRDVPLADALDRRPLRAEARRTGVIALVLISVVILWPGTLSGGAYRLWQYDRTFDPPRSFSVQVSPGNTEVARGTDVQVRITLRKESGPGRLPADAMLFLKGEGQTDFESVNARSVSEGSFLYDLEKVRYSYEYYAAAGSERSGVFRISVLDWPSLHSFRVRLDHPAYARLDPTVQEDFAGDISALAGTRVTVTGRASKPLRSGELRFADSSAAPLTVDEAGFTGSFTVSGPTSYAVHVFDTEGLANRSPIVYAVQVRPDAPPAVAITQPGRDIDIAGGEPVALFVEASDDYGISRLVLRYRLSHSRYVRPSERYDSLTIGFRGNAPRDVDVPYRWELGPLDLVPEDVVEYYVEAFDNDVVSGPKSARSALYTLRLPSLEEVFTDLDAGHTRALDELDKTLTDAKKLREDIEAINRDMKTNKEFDWQDQQKAREMSGRVEDIRKQLQRTEDQIKRMTEEMQRQQVLSPETLEKYLELQSLFEEMNTEELQQALRRMQQAMEGVRRDQLQDAMQSVEFSEERFRQGIERTLNLMKRLQIEQKMNEASKRAEELAASQEQLREDAAPPTEETAQRQEDLAAEQQRLESLMEDLQKRMEEFFTEMPADKLGEMNRQLQKDDLQERMQQAAAQMRAGKPQQAQQTQQQVQQRLETLSEQLQALQQEMLENQTEQILNSLRRATTDLLELSERQESVKNDAQAAPNNSPGLRENAQRQMQIMRDLNSVASSLSELAQKSFAVTPGMGRSIGESMQSMQNAMRDLDVRNGGQAAQDQTSAMGALNEAAREVQASLEAMMQGAQGAPGGMGLMQQLQMMAGQQMQLNAQTRRLGEGMGQSDAMRRAEEAGRIAREQEAVRKSLEQLRREAEASGDRDRILGDLEQVANEMREVVRDLQQNDIDDPTIRRQERILSRLLDASRSMRERDYEKRREATTGRRYTRTGPGTLPTEETRNWLRQEMLRALERGYSRDYQELIRTYFEELERAEAGQ